MGPLARQVGTSAYTKSWTDWVIQPVEFIRANNILYHEGNVIKYVCRHSFKNGVEDIEKAIHYLEMIRDDYRRREATALDAPKESHPEGFEDTKV